MLKNVFKVIVYCLLFTVYGLKGQDLEKIPLPNLSVLSISSNIKLVLIKSNESYFAFDKEEGAHHVNYNYVDNKLTVSKDEEMSDEETLTVYVYFKKIDELIAGGNSVVNSLSRIEQDRFSIYANGNALVDLNLELKTLTVNLSSNARVTVRGRAINEKVSAEGLSLFRGEDLVCQTVILNAQGSSQIYVNADKEIKGRAGTTTSIYYRGDPARIKINSSVSFTTSTSGYTLKRIG
tara:strand:- start:210 stop:917 length:708 start_codon:yes stop_codon:yes gene_type:complete